MYALTTPIQQHTGSSSQPIKQVKEVNGIDWRGKNKTASICRQLTYKKAPRTNKLSKVI